MEEATRSRLALAVAVIGFIILLINAIDYLGGYNNLSGGEFLAGLMLVLFGMYLRKPTTGKK